MNERIKELLEQVGGYGAKALMHPDDVEKFAELIVRDVVSTVKRTQPTSPDFEWVILNCYDLDIE